MFRDMKSAFGQTSNTTTFGGGGGGFTGGAAASPFGQTTFGKTTTSGFTTPAFGSTGTSLFGSNTSTAGGLFGGASATPVFGQAQTTQPSAFGFAGNSSINTLFGNQQNANTSLFGGTTGGTAFGQNKATFGGFGTPGTSLFGQQQPPQATSSLFGQPSATTSTGIFGSGGFGSNTAASAAVGTPIKFIPATGTDTMVKGGVTQTINTRHHCITCMKEYESKSLEELRLEDYAANRKGPQQATQQTGLFGASTQQSLFGSGASTSAGGSSLFPDKPLFAGTTSMGFGSTPGVFGSTNQQASALFGKSTGFGAVTTTTASGFSFNTTTTANPFGASTQPKPFGTVAPQTSSLFGAPTSQASTFGGQTTGFGGFGSQPNQSIGLFGQNKTPFNMATTSAGFSFGQNTPTNQTSSLFGKPAVTPGFGSFGATATPGFGSVGMFGTNQNTSLFNQPFNKPNTSSFSFGQTTPATSGLGTGLNLGGQSLFGQTSKPSGLFGTGTGMFGGGGSFGTSTNFGLGSGLGTSMNMGGNPLLGGTGIAAPTNQQANISVHEQILALASMPFGDTPLFRNLLPATGKTDELLKPSNPAQKAALVNNQFKVSPRGNTKLRVKPLGASHLSKKALFEGLEEECPQMEKFSPRLSTKRLVLKPKPLLEHQAPSDVPAICELRESNKENSEELASNEEWHLNKLNKSQEKDDEHQPSESQSTSRNIEELNNSLADLRPQRIARSSLNSDIKDVSNGTSSSSEDSQVSDDFATVKENKKTHPTGITLNRVGYYTIPSLDDLIELIAEDGSCLVENFTIGRKGYGNVFFPDSFDVSGLNLDEIVHFRHKEIVLYPDDDKKPSVGKGLNRKAQVTLDRVWPVDKSTHEPITESDRLMEMNYEDKLRRVCAKLQTRFLEYRPQTGSWVFKVEHFSKYGLSDSDEEDVPVSNIKQLKPGISLKPGLVKPVEQVEEKEVHGLVGTLLSDELTRAKPGLIPVLLEDDHDMEEGLRRNTVIALEENPEDVDNIQQSPTVQLAKELGRSSHNVQLMKASFFMDEDIQSEDDYMELTQFNENQLLQEDSELLDGNQDKDALSNIYGIFRTRFTKTHIPSRTSISTRESDGIPSRRMDAAGTLSPMVIEPPVEHPKTVVLKYPSQVLPLEETSAGELDAAYLPDLSLFRGRSFHVGWGPGGTLMTLTTQQAASVQPLEADFTELGNYVSGRAPSDYSPPIVQRLRISGADTTYGDSFSSFSENMESHLQVQLQHSVPVGDTNCPGWGADHGVEVLHAHCALARDTYPPHLYSRQVWELCVALWGNLPSLDGESSSTSHHTVMMRRDAVTEWLESVVQPSVERETAQVLGTTGDPQDSERHVSAILSFLSSRSLMEACEQAQSCNDHYAAILLAQISGGQAVRQMVQQQLVDWQDVEADAFINRDRLKMLMLVAGIPLFTSTHGTINVCENLDWKRAFALHLWYICSPTASVTDALLLYEVAFGTLEEKDTYARRPDPPYFEDNFESELSSSHPVYDLCYHLLKLYSSRSHPLEPLLNPATHTPDPLDYRLSWLLQLVLNALGYGHLSSYSAAHLHTSFALQLESHGLWHWAIFVLLHLEEPFSRKSAVLDMLGRHIELSESERYLDKEDFLTEKLRIPPQWLFQAKATLAMVQKEYCKAAWYLMKSGQLNEGHEVIMQHIAASAVINENYEYLKYLLEPLVSADPNQHISGWNNGGQILWDYLQVVAEVKRLLAHPEQANTYQLEKLQPQLSSLCSRINTLPCPTARDRLCQSEIALRTAHLVRNVLLLQNGKEKVSSRVLALLVTQLPLPEDYARDELNQVVWSVVSELMPPH